jgi:hypothetical protein
LSSSAWAQSDTEGFRLHPSMKTNPQVHIGGQSSL